MNLSQLIAHILEMTDEAGGVSPKVVAVPSEDFDELRNGMIDPVGAEIGQENFLVCGVPVVRAPVLNFVDIQELIELIDNASGFVTILGVDRGDANAGFIPMSGTVIKERTTTTWPAGTFPRSAMR